MSRTALLGLIYDISDLDLKNTRTTLMNPDRFYGILKLDLKSTSTTLVDLD